MIYSISKTFLEFIAQALALLTLSLLVAPYAHQTISVDAAYKPYRDRAGNIKTGPGKG
jgi:hypothetical protein